MVHGDIGIRRVKFHSFLRLFRRIQDLGNLLQAAVSLPERAIQHHKLDHADHHHTGNGVKPEESSDGDFACRNAAATYPNEFGVETIVPSKGMFLVSAIVCALVLIPMFFLLKKGVDPVPTPEEEKTNV